ncbi:GyrI-like domain-containing protein [uncultured Cohaesibacter sp.]|uniref:GyrI-like domain-containing protein n=1 Tax=uncultured Cohaesibacter sp. TaxID=1002546 RepID=UPI00292F22A2|nr:GyrI-like domain-containing protein [uncultured Cohaesibacter sp.]
MEKVDFKKIYKTLYKPSAKRVEFVEVPQFNFLMIDGEGDPNKAQAFQDAIEALYSLSYTLKFMVKKGEIGKDYGVMPLEGLWWVEDMSAFSVENKDGWQWTLMMMQPDFITKAMVGDAFAEVERKKSPTALGKVRFEAFGEGRAAQILHVGPFTEEGPTVEKLHAFIEQSGLGRTGKHHEIYLSDTRRADPAKWKTIIRQPVA